MIQYPNPYVQQAFDAIMVEFILSAGGLPNQEIQERILAALEHLADDSYNEGLEAERRPS